MNVQTAKTTTYTYNMHELGQLLGVPKESKLVFAQVLRFGSDDPELQFQVEEKDA